MQRFATHNFAYLKWFFSAFYKGSICLPLWRDCRGSTSPKGPSTTRISNACDQKTSLLMCLCLYIPRWQNPKSCMPWQLCQLTEKSASFFCTCLHVLGSRQLYHLNFYSPGGAICKRSRKSTKKSKEGTSALRELRTFTIHTFTLHCKCINTNFCF